MRDRRSIDDRLLRRTYDPEVTPGPSRRRRFNRYAALSVTSVATGHIMLYVLHSALGVAPVAANVTSTVANTVLVFWSNRRWVWSTNGRPNVGREVVPFASFAALGLALSTITVWATARWVGDGLWINLANLAAFGTMWLVRFAVLDTVIYGRTSPRPQS